MGRPPMRLSPETPKPPACSASTLPRRCNAWAVWAVQPQQDFVSLWAGAWLTGWLFAFPAVMLAAPLARKAVALLTARG